MIVSWLAVLNTSHTLVAGQRRRAACKKKFFINTQMYPMIDRKKMGMGFKFQT